jgi:signal transduction histidine kinase
MASAISSNLPPELQLVPHPFPDRNAAPGEGGLPQFHAEPGDQNRILVVDDDPDILSVNLTVLREAGFMATGATTAADCLAAVQAEQPDMVLLDINLPDLSGLELCRRLKADPATSGIAIVHLSGDRVSSEEQAAGLESGADGYIARPISNNELIARVKAMLRLKRTEAELRQVTMELRAQRMASMGTLADGIAHDLNNVLAPLLMGIHLLKQKHKDDASQELLSTMEFSARRGAALVEQVLSFAHGEEGQRSMIQPRHLIMEVFETVMESLPKSINPELDLELNLWNIACDPAQLRQVLLNLCANARDAMPDGGQLVLSAGNAILDERTAGMNPGASSGPHVVIQVRDTGAGMSRDILEKIFDPFFTTREFGKGVGLGLSTSLGIVRNHGGFIQVQSEPGKGSTFKVHLPAAASGKLPAASERRAEYSRGHGELLMVVDDDAPMRTVTQQTLETFGYRVLPASNGSDAAAIYTARQAEIALVVMDMMMPVQDGPATIRMLASMNPR